MRSWIIGAKNNLIVERALTDIKRGRRVVFVDPNGQDISTILQHFPQPRECLLFDPSDYEWPIAWNPLADIPEEKRALTAKNMLDTMRSAYKFDISTPDYDQHTYMSLAALLDTGGSLLHIDPLLDPFNDTYRKRILPQIKDIYVKRLWDRYERLLKDEPKETRAVTKSTINKITTLFADPRVRNTLGQTPTKLRLSDTRVLLASFPRSRLGNQTSTLLGSLLISQLYATPGHFRVYIADPHRFEGSALLDLIADPRFNLTVSHSYLSQLGDELKAALFGEMERRYVFRVGIEDSERLHRTIPHDNIEPELHKLDPLEARIFEGERASRRFFPLLPPGNQESAERVAMISRRTYASARRDVESVIGRFLEGV